MLIKFEYARIRIRIRVSINTRRAIFVISYRDSYRFSSMLVAHVIPAVKSRSKVNQYCKKVRGTYHIMQACESHVKEDIRTNGINACRF